MSLAPPLVLACVDKNADLHHILPPGQRVVFNILSASQEALSRRFSEEEGSRRFDGVGLRRDQHGVAVLEAGWAPQSLSTLCSDCIRTTLALKQRDGDVVRVYRASWDDSQPITPQLRELRRLALELRSARSPR